MARPRKPIADHLAEGTYRPDRHGDVAGPFRATSGRPPMPRGLSEREKTAWRTITADLERHGILFRLDAPLIEAAAVQWARAREARALVRRHGLLVVGARGGLVANPAVRMERDAWRLLVRLAGELGLSSTARARLGIAAGELPPVPDGPEPIGPSPRLRAIEGGSE